ncbi:adenylate/guanylate cyclase domain-containing protein [Sporosarcina sp. CAU 1771]
MKKLIVFQKDKVLDFPLETAWNLLVQTNDLNRYIGLFPVQFTPFTEGQESLVRHSEATAFGLIKTEWKENVFEWHRNDYYSIERIYSKGPLSHALWKVSVAKVGENRTRISLKGEFTVHNLFGRIVLHTIIFPQLIKTFDYVNEYEVGSAGSSKRSFLEKKKHNVQNEHLDILIKKLKGLFKEDVMIEQLKQTLLIEEDSKVVSMKPYEWAQKYTFDKRLTVNLFLFATKVGLLDQEWSMMCPNCRVPKGRANTMKQVESKVHCDLCGVDYEVDFDKYIELRFNVHPSIRKTNEETFCINGPMNSPHIISQFRIGANAKKELILSDWTPNLRWRVIKDNRMLPIDTSDVRETTELNFTEKGFSQKIARKSEVIQFYNETDKEIVLVLEETEWDQLALTARDATSFQLFRDLFATEVLATNEQISVGQLTILFTDLKGSTQLYEAIGDGPAYSNVKKHFDYLMGYIRENEGAVVKTIGDSVMAVFTNESNALKAALDIQHNLSLLNKTITKPVEIRIGFHTGPVIAVNANEILDYFGQTVNLAARIQQEGLGNDIILSESTFKDICEQTQYQKIVSELTIETITRQLQGVNKDIKLIRIAVD